MVVLKIVGRAIGLPSVFDGRYLVEYDPEIDGRDPKGRPMRAHVVTTSNKSEARQYADSIEAFGHWKQQCKREPVRPDGKPNRPLTAFTVELEKV